MRFSFALALVVALGSFAAWGQAATVGQTGSFGSYGFGNGQFANGTMVGVDPVDGSIYAGDLTQQNSKEQRENYRIQKFSPSGTYEASVLIPRYSDSPSNEKLVLLHGIAVDPGLHRFYVLEGAKEKQTTGELYARQIRVYSTVPQEGKLVPPEGGPTTLPLPPVSGPEAIDKPRSISVDPSNHELVVFGETEAPRHAVVQRVSSSGTIGKRFVDSGNKLSPSASKRAFSATVGSDGTIYALTGNRANLGSGETRAWEIPPAMTEVKEVPGFAAAAASEAWPFALWDEPFTPNTGGPQIAISPDGKTLYWKEESETVLERSAANMIVRGFSLTEDATTVVYGGGSTEGSCRIATPNAGIGVTGKGAAEKVVVFDYGQLNEEKAEAPAYGGKVLTFGPGGSGCFDPVAKFTANGTEATAKAKAGETVTFDASGSELASGPTKTPGARRELIWNFGDGTEEVVKAAGSGEAPATATHDYTTPGTYTATLQIHLKTPSYGNPQPVSHTVEVETAGPEFALTVAKEGTGSGTVTSSPVGIDCGTECSHSYAEGETVTLTGTPTAGSEAVAWAGCDSVNGSNQCVVTISAAKSVTATFEHEVHTLTVGKNGSGTVTSAPAGIDCGSECSKAYEHGTVVTLTGTPSAGFKPVAWAGCDSVNVSNQCVVTMDADENVEASFAPVGSNSLTVTKEGSGEGTVASAPAGIDCGSECSHAFTEATMVTLTGTPAANSEPVAWTGCDTVTAGECEVAMSAAKEVKATFQLKSYLLTVSKSGTGTVTSAPAGINCGSGCSHAEHAYTAGTLVKLAGTTSGPTPVTWTGCGAVNGTGECEVTMSAAKEVKATFAAEPRTLTVTRLGSGAGTVVSSPTGISCGATCSAGFDEGTVVELIGTPAAGSTAVVWESGCTVVDPSTNRCEVAMEGARSVSFRFDTIEGALTIVKAGTGIGYVASAPAGISCGGTCRAAFPLGRSVVLTGVSGAGTKEVAWAGCDRVFGPNRCEVTVGSASRVTATFAPSSSSAGQSPAPAEEPEAPHVSGKKTKKQTARQKAIARCRKTKTGKARQKCIRNVKRKGKKAKKSSSRGKRDGDGGGRR